MWKEDRIKEEKMVTSAKRTDDIGPGKISVQEINKTDGFTPRVQRMKKRLTDTKSVADGNRARLFTESLRMTEAEHRAVRKAKAFSNWCHKVPICIRDDELLVAGPTPHVRGGNPNVEMAPNNLLMLFKMAKAASTGTAATDAVLNEEDQKALIECAEYWSKSHYRGKDGYKLLEEHAGGLHLKHAAARIVLGGVPQSPTCLATGADYERVLNKGFNDFIREAKDEMERTRKDVEIKRGDPAENMEKIEVLEGIITALEGMIDFAHRHAELARQMAAKEKDPQRKKELQRIAEVCDWVPANPARNFWEALQSYWFVVIGHDIEKAMPNNFAGRWDQYMYPFYERDIREGRMTRQEAAELIGCMFINWARLEPFLYIGLIGTRGHQDVATSNYIANVTIGGMTTAGRDASNELACLLLHVCGQVKVHQPHISIRYHHGMAPELLDKAIECNREIGGGIPAWFNDRAMVEYLLDRGHSLDDARNAAIAGCINTAYCPSLAYIRVGGPGLINHAKLFELALNDGINPDTGDRIGPPTGDARDFKTFDDVMKAYKEQVHYFYDCYHNYNKKFGPTYYTEDTDYFPFISALLQDCIKKGKDAVRQGLRYWEMESAVYVDRALTDVGDCLAALKKVVFDDKAATMGQVMDALKADFVGYDELRQKLLAAPKFGNDDPYVDDITSDIWEWTKRSILKYRDYEGRRYVIFRQGAAWAAWAGATTGALPNGRKAWTTLADASASPESNCDRSGPTAVLNSVSKLDPGHMEGPLLNMKFSPSILKSKEGKKKFADMLGTFFDKGGFHVQFNIIDRETLLKAKANPQEYKNLVVRVAGYSAFWGELVPEVQQDIIDRTDHAF
jgi:pyruvate formate-lyase/glycerol dehydratase family glycyl radical enzyme